MEIYGTSEGSIYCIPVSFTLSVVLRRLIIARDYMPIKHKFCGSRDFVLKFLDPLWLEQCLAHRRYQVSAG